MLALAAAVCACNKRRTPPAPAPKTFDAEPWRSRARVPSIAYAAFRRERVVVVSAVGTARDGVPATKGIPFPAASIAKLVLACAALRAREEHLLSLQDDVERYVGFPVRHPSGVPLEIRALLAHTASVADAADVGVPGTLAGFLHEYFARPSAFLPDAPFTRYAYSNAGAALAALAVEHATGVEYRRYVATRLFVPLGMTHASFEATSEAAAPHVARGASFERIEPRRRAVYPASDLYASAEDLARFGRAVLAGGELDGVRILSRESVDDMLSVAYPAVTNDQALGWQIRTIGGVLVRGHEGEDAGVSTALFLDTGRAAGAVVLANGDAFQSGDQERARALEDLLETLLAIARRGALP